MSAAWIRLAPGIDERIAARLLAPQALLARPAGVHALALPEFGLGELQLTVWHSARVGERLGARFTHPRSASAAERDWNLICHARRHGIGTAEPLAVGAAGRGWFCADSFLLCAPPRSVLSLAEWTHGRLAPELRARGARALLETVERMANCGLLLPELAPEHVCLSAEQALGAEAGEEHGECGLPAPLARGAARNRLPSVYVLGWQGGRLLAKVSPRERARMRARMERALANCFC